MNRLIDRASLPAFLLCLATAVLPFVSCVEEYPRQAVPSNDPLVLAAQQVTVSSDTKAPLVGTTFPTSRPMVVSAYASSSSSTYFSGIEFSYDETAGGWEAGSAEYWPQEGTLDFLAYSCPDLTPSVSWNTNASYQMTFTVGTDATGRNRTVQDDILFGAAAGCSYSPSSKPGIAFKHALALVSFTGRCPDMSHGGGNGITIESITLASAYYGGTCIVTRSGSEIGTMSWSLGDPYDGAEVPGISSQGLTTSAAALGDGIMLPPQGAVDFTINYKEWSGGVATSKSYTHTNSGSWEMGKKHVYAIEISAGNEISVMAGVEDWSDTAKTWFYADGNVVTRVGTDFTLASGQPVFWRPGGSGAYEQLTYHSGTYGSAVTYSSADYYVTVTRSGSTYTVSYVSKDRTEYGYQLFVSPSSASISASGTQQLSAFLQHRTRTWSGGVAGGWGDWSTCATLMPTWSDGGSTYASVNASGLVTGTNEDTESAHDVTITGSWTSHIGGQSVLLSGTSTITVARKPSFFKFGNLYIANAPLYHDGSGFVIKDPDWNLDSYGTTYGAVGGSYYFNWNECQGVSGVSYGGYDDWRMPTRADWCTITTGEYPGTSRAGSTVNGNSGSKYAIVELTGVAHAGSSTPVGLLLFPDSLTITGKALSGINNTTCTTGVTGSELEAYLNQGCVFLPASGFCYIGNWYAGGEEGYYRSSTSSWSIGYMLSFHSSSVNPANSIEKETYYYSCRLVRDSSSE